MASRRANKAFAEWLQDGAAPRAAVWAVGQRTTVGSGAPAMGFGRLWLTFRGRTNHTCRFTIAGVYLATLKDSNSGALQAIVLSSCWGWRGSAPGLAWFHPQVRAGWHWSVGWGSGEFVCHM